MTLSDLVTRVKAIPKSQGEDQVKRYMLELIGKERAGQILENRYKRKLRNKVGEL